MSSKAQELGGESAFTGSGRYGLTKREYFAGQAMQGLLAAGPSSSPHQTAIEATEFADALLDLLTKEAVKPT